MELRVPGRYLPFVSWLNRPDSPFRVRAARGDRVVLSDDGHLASWTAFDSATAALAADEPNRFVVARTLTRHERALLENNGVGYADAAGHAYLRDGPVL